MSDREGLEKLDRFSDTGHGLRKHPRGDWINRTEALSLLATGTEGPGWRGLAEKAIAVLQRHIIPGGISDRKALELETDEKKRDGRIRDRLYEAIEKADEAFRRYPDPQGETPDLSIKNVIEWLRQRPGESWKATIEDIESARTALAGATAHRDQTEALAKAATPPAPAPSAIPEKGKCYE